MARTRKIDVLLEQLGRVEQLVDKLDRRVEKIELVTVIREPNSGLAADAYNGLRKQVIAAVTERNAHLHQLAQFDSAVRGETSTDHLSALVGEWLAQAGVEVVADPRLEEAFQFVGEADGVEVQVVRPAYIDSATGRVIQTGVAERVRRAPASLEARGVTMAEVESDQAEFVADAPAEDGAPATPSDELASAVASNPTPLEGEPLRPGVPLGPTDAGDPAGSTSLETRAETETTSSSDQEKPK